MTVIRQEDLIESIADALQFISYYHPLDFIRAMRGAWEKEESPSAKAALTQVLVNSRMCAIGKRPICQDTGIVNVFISVGMDVSWEADMSLEDMINEGVRRGYTHPENVLRGSVLEDPDGARANTKDNTPAVIHPRIVPGDKIEIEANCSTPKQTPVSDCKVSRSSNQAHDGKEVEEVQAEGGAEGRWRCPCPCSRECGH